MMSERTTLIRLAALCLALAPLPVAFAFSETDLATLKETGSCSGCDLAGADLYEADLFQADLSLSDLSGADLTAADLTLANLRSVDLRGAILDETNLSGANLAKAILDKDALAGAIFDSERTRTTLGFKDLKLGMNAVEVAQYCSIETVHGKTVYLGTPLGSTIKQLDGTCFDNADMPFTFKFSGGGTTGVLNFLQVGLAPYTEKGHRKFIDLLAKKYDPAYSYSAQDVAAFNNNRDLDIKRLNTIFANGQVTLSIVGEGAGLQMLLSYRDIEHGRRFLKLKGDLAPVDLTHLPPITADLYKLVGNYKLKGIGAKGTNTNHGRIDTAYLEIDAFENELAGELVISGHGMSGRFRIIGIEKISGNRLTVQLEPVTGTIPDGRPLRMSLEFAEDGNSFTGKWTNWFRLKNAKSRRPDDFKGSRSQSFWQTAMSHNRIDMYQAYLRLRPGGIYSAVARSRITELGGTLAAPSAPTVSVAVAAAASTSVTPTTTTATTATGVDPLVGIWQRRELVAASKKCYLIISMDEQGRLASRSWQVLWNLGTSGFREITIAPLADGSYSWHSDQSVPGSNEGSFPLHGAADDGKFWLKVAQNNPPQLTSNDHLCVHGPGEPRRESFEKLSLEEALALELPAGILQDFPSPFATEGPQVVSVPKATASASAAPSTSVTPTATTTIVDPLVGVWVRTGSDIAWTNECWLLVGQTEDGILIGKAQDSTRKHRGNFSDKGKDIHLQDGYAFGLKEISFERQSKMNYLWSSKSNPFKSESSIDPAMSGRISIQLNEQGSDYLVSKGLLCRKRQSQSLAKFRRLTITEALELTLHPDLLKDFPSPFATEGPQVASVPKATTSVSAAPSTPTTTITTTATAVDPLVGIWLRYEPDLFGNACRLIVGQDDNGNLVGQVWEEAPKVRLEFDEQNLETIDGHKVAVTKITFQRDSSLRYRWRLEESVFKPTSVFRGASKEGSISILDGKKGEYLFSTNALMCRQKRATSPMSTFRKLTEDEALAMDLHPEIFEGFPSPFQDGTQWSGDAVATEASETTENQAATSKTDGSDTR